MDWKFCYIFMSILSYLSLPRFNGFFIKNLKKSRWGDIRRWLRLQWRLWGGGANKFSEVLQFVCFRFFKFLSEFLLREFSILILNCLLVLSWSATFHKTVLRPLLAFKIWICVKCEFISFRNYFITKQRRWDSIRIIGLG
jgi:hypothetical protein